MPEPRKNKESRKSGRLPILYFLGLLLAVSSALPAYIQSNFLGQFVSIRTISIFFVIANFLCVFAILAFPSLIKTLGNYFITKAVLVLYLASLFGLVVAATPLTALLSITLFTITSNLVWINMDVLVESFSNNRTTGRTRAIYFTFINCGWILSPLLSSYLIARGQYTLTFLVAGFLVIPFYLIFAYHGRKLKDTIKYKKDSILTTLKKTWVDSNLRGIFFVALLLQIFYSSAVIYIPLHLYRDLGMSWETLGVIFSLMLIPFIVVEIPAGVIADKYLGEKEILFVGFLILTVSLFLFYYIETPEAWLWALVLFTSRIGAALIETMKEAYFFKLVDAKSVGCINLFRATTPLAYVLAAGLAILSTSYFPLAWLFLFLGVIMISGFGFVASLTDTK